MQQHLALAAVHPVSGLVQQQCPFHRIAVAVLPGRDVSTVTHISSAKTLGEGLINNAVFIAFAPYENPEIAVSVVIEGGSAGAIGAQIAREVFDYWLAAGSDSSFVETENSLLK